MIYMYCSSCRKITFGSTARFSDSIACSSCASKLRLRDAVTRKCSKCSNLLYAPSDFQHTLPFPCHPANGTALSSANDDYPVIPCSRCQADIKSSMGRYDPCPLCGTKLSAEYISQQLYLIGGKHKPIQITWDPDAKEMVYEHHHSSSIPPYSLLIVNPEQMAAYYSGGQRVVLTNNTYSLFDEDPNIASIAQSIFSGSSELPPQFLKLNTKIIFFDTHTHNIDFEITAPLADGARHIRLPVCIAIKIIDPETFLQNAFNLQDSASISGFLTNKAREVVTEGIWEQLDDISPQAVQEAASQQQLRLLLRDAFSLDALQRMIRENNPRLHSRYGIIIEDIEKPLFHKAEFLSDRPDQLQPASSREQELRDRVRRMSSNKASPAGYISELKELWQDYHDERCAVMLIGAYAVSGDRQNAIHLYNELINSTNSETIHQLRALKQILNP